MTRLDRKKTWQADSRGIFTSLIYPLAKAVTYFRSQNNRTSYVDHRPGLDWASIEFNYPVVVTSAPIYLVDVAQVDPQPGIVPWGTITREIKAKKVAGQFNVDVVTSDHFADYMNQRVLQFADQVAAIATENPQRFITRKDLDFEVRSG